MPTDDQRSRPARILRVIALGEIALGLALLIAGFAADLMILVIVGVVMVASSGSLFVFARALLRQQGQGGSGGAGADQPPPRWPPE